MFWFFEVHANHVDHVSSVFEFALENNLDTKYGYFEIKRINAERGAMVRVVTYSGFAFWVKKNLVKGRKVWKAWKRLSAGEKAKLTKAIKFETSFGEDQVLASSFLKDEAAWCKAHAVFVLEKRDDLALVVCDNE